MNNTSSITKQRTVANENVSVELNKVGAVTVGIASGLIGCWAVACLAAGMISSGGPVSLVSNYMKAFIG
jgi:hypothetical protein